MTDVRSTFTIPLTRGQVALVDERDFYRLRKHKWNAQWAPDSDTYYAKRFLRRDGRDMAESMHRRIMNLEFGDKRQVDHVSHNGLDNRRQNLRIVTLRQNHENLRKQSPHGPGVNKDAGCKSRPFRVQARVDGRRLQVGMFATAEEAREARRKFLEERGLR